MKTPRSGLAERMMALARLPRPAGNFVSLTSLAQLLDLSVPSARVAANRLVNRKIISRVGPSLYANLLADPSAEQLASLLWRPSYISLEWAMAYHGLSQQKPAEVTCVTLQRPRRVPTAWGTLSYAHLAKPLFFGYRKEKVRADTEAWVAEPEKALLDWIYLRRRAGESIALDELDTARLRKDVLRRYKAAFPVSVQKQIQMLFRRPGYA